MRDRLMGRFKMSGTKRIGNEYGGECVGRKSKVWVE